MSASKKTGALSVEQKIKLCFWLEKLFLDIAFISKLYILYSQGGAQICPKFKIEHFTIPTYFFGEGEL